MDSSPSNTPSNPSQEGPRNILFERAEDFKLRAGYRENVELPLGHTFVIIGGYHFKKSEWVRCGVTGCKQVHGSGFVIRSTEGLETNIGHCCGESRLGGIWKVMFDTFQAQRKEAALQDVLARVIDERDKTLKQAESAKLAFGAATKTVRGVVDALECYGPLKRAFWSCVKQRGSLVYYRDLTANEREMAPGQYSVRETKGQILGWHSAAEDSSSLERELRFHVIVPLADLQPDVLQALPARDLEKKLLEFSRMAAIIQRAEVFIEDATKLATPTNWTKFEMFCDASKVRLDHQGYKALRTLAGTA